jgi:hypothetical protein
MTGVSGRIYASVAVLLAAGVVLSCEHTRPPCRKSADCRENGFCTEAENGVECVAGSDADCGRATICIVHSRCKARDGKCVLR